MQLRKSLWLLALAGFLTACGGEQSAVDTATAPLSPSTAPATAQNDDDGWTSLFDGETLAGWHKYGGDGEEIGSAWKIMDGAIHLDVSDKDDWQTANGGDIVSDESFANYELELEWKIGECGNSGIIYNVQETEDYPYPWMTGPEMQILDNTCHPDAEIVTHRAGDLYDIQSVREENVKPAGEWNKVKLVVTPGRVEHWLNGVQQVVYANTGDDWKAMIADSKFKDMENWGMFTEGRISLQDHGDPVWFRNIRIRELSK